MKKITQLLIFLLPLSIWGQKTQAKAVAVDTPFAKINLITGEITNYKGSITIARFELNCNECFSMRQIAKDTTSSDTLATDIKLLTYQGKVYFYEEKNFVNYQKSKETDDTDIKQIDAEINALKAEKQRKIDEKKRGKQ